MPFWELSEWVHHRSGQRSGIALLALVELLYLTEVRQQRASLVAESHLADYRATGYPDTPPFLQGLVAPSIGHGPLAASACRLRQPQYRAPLKPHLRLLSPTKFERVQDATSAPPPMLGALTH